MKKLFLLFAFIGIVYGQVIDGTIFKNAGGSLILDKTFRYPMNDTTQWLNNWQYRKLWLNIQANDSARFILYYQTGYDTTNFGSMVNFDSVVSTAKVTDTWDATNYIGGFPFIRFLVKNDTVTVTDSVIIYEGNTAKIDSVAYAASQVDTTQWINLQTYSTSTLYLKTMDSARILITAQVANDTTSISAVYSNFDSLSTTTNTGAQDTYDITRFYQNYTYVRFLFSFAASGQGVSSPRYYAWYRRIAFGHDRGTYRIGYKREK